MTQIEKIKAEIERLRAKTSIGLNEYTAGYENGKAEVCHLLLGFINSLQKELVSEDLEEELNNQMNSIYPLPEEDDFDDPCYSESNTIKILRIGFKKGFKVGSNWQKEQMLKNAVKISFNFSLPLDVYDKLGCKEGDNLLIIKQD